MPKIPKRFFVQQLDVSPPVLPLGRNTRDYFDSFEEAVAALDAAMEAFPPCDRPSVRQEITDTASASITWTRHGFEPWSQVENERPRLR
jgi:hypothetical protein